MELFKLIIDVIKTLIEVLCTVGPFIARCYRSRRDVWSKLVRIGAKSVGSPSRDVEELLAALDNPALFAGRSRHPVLDDIRRSMWISLQRLDELHLLAVAEMPGIDSDRCWAMEQIGERSGVYAVPILKSITESLSNPDPVRNAALEAIKAIEIRTLVMSAKAAEQADSMDEEQIKTSLSRIMHELKTPLVVSLGAVSYMQKEMQTKGWRLSADYLDDIEGYLLLMRSIVHRADFLRSDGSVTLHRTRVKLQSDIVGPAVRQVRKMLDEPGLPIDKIDYRNIQLPALFLDKEKFQQIVFNLLSNSIKYACAAPSSFRIEFVGQASRGCFEFVIRDWGIGIEAGTEEAIFEEGIRGKNAVALDVSGDGVGLWITRKILDAHGASIKVTRLRNPTEFTIFLPLSLQQPPAESSSSEEAG